MQLASPEIDVKPGAQRVQVFAPAAEKYPGEQLLHEYELEEPEE